MTALHTISRVGGGFQTISRESSANHDFVKDWLELNIRATVAGLWRVDARLPSHDAKPGKRKGHTRHCFVGVGVQWVDVRVNGDEEQVSELIIAKLNALVSIYAPCKVAQPVRAVA